MQRYCPDCNRPLFSSTCQDCPTMPAVAPPSSIDNSGDPTLYTAPGGVGIDLANGDMVIGGVDIGS